MRGCWDADYRRPRNFFLGRRHLTPDFVISTLAPKMRHRDRLFFWGHVFWVSSLRQTMGRWWIGCGCVVWSAADRLICEESVDKLQSMQSQLWLGWPWLIIDFSEFCSFLPRVLRSASLRNGSLFEFFFFFFCESGSNCNLKLVPAPIFRRAIGKKYSSNLNEIKIWSTLKPRAALDNHISHQFISNFPWIPTSTP